MSAQRTVLAVVMVVGAAELALAALLRTTELGAYFALCAAATVAVGLVAGRLMRGPAGEGPGDGPGDGPDDEGPGGGGGPGGDGPPDPPWWPELEAWLRANDPGAPGRGNGRDTEPAPC